MSKIKDLQRLELDSPEKLAKAKPAGLSDIFTDESVVKKIISSAKRVSKKRAAGDMAAPSPKKQRKQASSGADAGTTSDLEASLALPGSDADKDELASTVVITNRAPLVLAFVLTLLKHTMPEQPLSSRLSLGQGYVSTTSRNRAVNLGIQHLSKQEEDAEQALGEGQPTVTIMGHPLKILRRWGYEWNRPVEPSQPGAILRGDDKDPQDNETDGQSGDEPAVWALDLEALRKSNRADIMAANLQAGNQSNLPIYTPHTGRAYLLKSFDSVPSAECSATIKLSAAEKAADRERNVGKLLRALDLVYDSWVPVLSPEELDKRTWGWYVKVRPAVENGVAGWGGKNELRLADILALRRPD
jgi:hypothetical protein